MNRTESSAMSSLKQLMLEEEQHRAEQIALAHRRKVEQERELLEEQKRHAERERVLAEQAKQQAIQRANDIRADRERAERERLIEIERGRVESELRAKTALMKLDQQHCLERLAIERDVRLRRTEGHRTLLAALLGTLVLGTVTVYGLLLLPEGQQRERLIARLNEANATQRSEFERERRSLTNRIDDLEMRLADAQSRPEVAREESTLRESRPGSRTIPKPATPPKPPVQRTRCDDNDPLCGDIGAK